MKKYINNIVKFFGIEIVKLRPQGKYQAQRERPITVKHFFDLYFSLINPTDFFFIQIGANDGKTKDLLGDYIRKYKLRGILVEPQSDVFTKLKETYAGNQEVELVNIAISDQSGKQTFYTVKKELVNEKNYFEVTAISSFNKKVFQETLRKRIPDVIQYTSEDLDDYTEEIEVSALSLRDFIQTHNVRRMDFLFLDCEGYDFAIIKMIDFKNMPPGVINFESKFLNDSERVECESLLESHGYELFRHGNDTCAFRVAIDTNS